ncbi:PREDICTED: PMS1 protein homolog 1-like [Dufourea novaeangliae]|uniref:PMS1 protein homolog 1-like n=1 Tax=Dufourea novaeangliae TaxID=178035 RepID=UPI0007675775|nr:PREDICTED: PMS1 protein homolog 1-like [Dufourea novaeangliae]
MTISALDSDTVKLITTTQVITSVSNAAKELIENALDANANNIEVNLSDNGAALIEVKDDGCGITKTDAPYVALSAYTSKISNFSDMNSLETYGFRGQALYALSTMSDLTIISKTKQEEVATMYTIDHCGCIAKSEPHHRATGTTIQVRQLFKQIPVRRQIITNLKKANQDVKVLESFVKSYAMCKSFVRISYKVDGNVIFTKPSIPTLEEAVTYVLGKKVTTNMTWMDIQNAETSMKLMLPLKGTQNVSDLFQSGAQYIYVNNRPIKHKDLEKVVTRTILDAFQHDSSSRKKPIFLLYILTSAANIDVNLEPNKTSILFKEQQIVFDTVDKCVKDFYGIQKEVKEEDTCDESLNDYHDYTLKRDASVEESEWPACKKRHILLEESSDKVTEEYVDESGKCDNNADKNFYSAVNTNAECNKNTETVKNGQSNQDKNNGGYEKNLNDFNVQIPILHLSESDSNDSQKFTSVRNNNDTSCTRMKNTDDSPPLELDSQTETVSQLPTVDLGDDFEWVDSPRIDNTNKSEKENMTHNRNTPVSREQKKTKAEKCTTLMEWSKGQVPGLKGGTDVRPCININLEEPLESDSYHTNVCDGFINFSKQNRSQVVKQNPNMTAPQIAQILTNLWKNLSSEERGYYRDLACDDKIEWDTRQEKTKEKSTTNDKKMRNRLLKVLGKMQTLDTEKQKNLFLRTIVPWKMNLEKVTESFLNNSACKNNSPSIGKISSDLWIVHKSAQLWLLNASCLKEEFNTSSTNANVEGTSNEEEHLKLWLLKNDDSSLLHRLYSLHQTTGL